MPGASGGRFERVQAITRLRREWPQILSGGWLCRGSKEARLPAPGFSDIDVKPPSARRTRLHRRHSRTDRRRPPFPR